MYKNIKKFVVRRQEAQQRYRIDSRFPESTQGYINGDHSTDQLLLHFNKDYKFTLVNNLPRFIMNIKRVSIRNYLG